MKHPSGKVIRLHKKYFYYYIWGEKNKFISGTKFINKYFPKFEREKVAKAYAKKHGLNWKEVEAEWIKAGKDSSARGTKYHKFAEDVYNRYKKNKEIKHNDKVGSMIIKKLTNIYKEYTPYEPEYIVGSLDLGVAGTIDLLFGKDGTLLIADWKFVKKMHIDAEWDTAFYPIEHMYDSNYNKYCLQLNLYSYIIKREKYFPEYGTHKMMIYHVKQNEIEDIEVPDLQKEIRDMLVVQEKNK